MRILVCYQLIVLVIFYSLMAEQEPDPSTCIDWSKCVLCQETTTEALQSPENLRRGDIYHGTGYRTLTSNILRFHEIDSLPVTIDITKLDDGNVIASTFTKRSAKWHKIWYNKFNSLIFQRAVKRKSLDNPSCSLPTKFPRNNSGARSSSIKSSCFFVMILQVLFIKPRHLTWIQEFVNVHFNSEIKHYLQN